MDLCRANGPCDDKSVCHIENDLAACHCNVGYVPETRYTCKGKKREEHVSEILKVSIFLLNLYSKENCC